MAQSHALHLAVPPPDTPYKASDEEIARAKAIHDRDVAQAEAEMRAAEEEERGAAILLIVELYEGMGLERAADLIDAIEHYGVDRARLWLSNIAAIEAAK